MSKRHIYGVLKDVPIQDLINVEVCLKQKFFINGQVVNIVARKPEPIITSLEDPQSVVALIHKKGSKNRSEQRCIFERKDIQVNNKKHVAVIDAGAISFARYITSSPTSSSSESSGIKPQKRQTLTKRVITLRSTNTSGNVKCATITNGDRQTSLSSARNRADRSGSVASRRLSPPRQSQHGRLCQPSTSKKRSQSPRSPSQSPQRPRKIKIEPPDRPVKNSYLSAPRRFSRSRERREYSRMRSLGPTRTAISRPCGPTHKPRSRSPGPIRKTRSRSRGPTHKPRSRSRGAIRKTRSSSSSTIRKTRSSSSGPIRKRRSRSRGAIRKTRSSSSSSIRKTRSRSPGPSYRMRSRSRRPSYRRRSRSRRPSYRRSRSPGPSYRMRSRSHGPSYRMRSRSHGPSYRMRHRSPGPSYRMRSRSRRPSYRRRSRSRGPSCGGHRRIRRYSRSPEYEHHRYRRRRYDHGRRSRSRSAHRRELIEIKPAPYYEGMQTPEYWVQAGPMPPRFPLPHLYGAPFGPRMPHHGPMFPTPRYFTNSHNIRPLPIYNNKVVPKSITSEKKAEDDKDSGDKTSD